VLEETARAKAQIEGLLLQPLFASLEPAFGDYGGIAAQQFSQTLVQLLEPHA